VNLFVTVLHVVVCLILIVVVLLQRGKGAEIGAVFGGGGGSTVFGARGAGNFLTRLTSAAAIVFMLTSLTLAFFAQGDAESTLFEGDEPAAQEQPASPFEESGPAAAPPEGETTSPFEEVPAQPAPGAEAPGAPAGDAEAAAAEGGPATAPAPEAPPAP
jgi:preprotein translocase subunit SecG